MKSRYKKKIKKSFIKGNAEDFFKFEAEFPKKKGLFTKTTKEDSKEDKKNIKDERCKFKAADEKCRLEKIHKKVKESQKKIVSQEFLSFNRFSVLKIEELREEETFIDLTESCSNAQNTFKRKEKIKKKNKNKAKKREKMQLGKSFKIKTLSWN